MPILALLLILFTSACTQKNVMTTTYYTLSLGEVPSAKTSKGVLAVNMLKPVSSLQSTSMIYSKQPLEINKFALSKWNATPDNILKNLLVEAFTRTNIFKGVTSSLSNNPNWVMNVRILDWHQQFITRPSSVRVSLVVDVFSVAERKILASRIFEQTIVCQEENAKGGVIAYNQAMAELIPAVIKFVRLVTINK